MTIRENTGAGGTHATNVSVANSGGASGDAFTAIVINGAAANGGGSAIQYRTEAALWEGSPLGFRYFPSASTSQLRWTDGSPTSDTLGIRGRFRYNGGPVSGSDMVIVDLRSAADNAAGNLIIDVSQQRLWVRNTSSVYLTGSNYTLTPGTTYDVEFYSTRGASSTTGRLRYRLYAAGGTTPLKEYDSGATVSAGTVQPAQIRWFSATSATTGVTSLDWAMMRGGTTVNANDWWGPIGPYTEPGDAGEDQTVEPWDTFTLTGTGTGTWSQDAGDEYQVTLSGSGDVRTAVAPVDLDGATLNFTFGGDTCVVTVLPATDARKQSGVIIPVRLRSGASLRADGILA